MNFGLAMEYSSTCLSVCGSARVHVGSESRACPGCVDQVIGMRTLPVTPDYQAACTRSWWGLGRAQQSPGGPTISPSFVHLCVCVWL